MSSRIALAVAGASIALLGLTGCSSSSPPAGTGAVVATTPPGVVAGGNSSGTTLKTANSALGTIVVDGAGMTIYQYDKDTRGSGTSTCSAGCLKNWPAVPGGSAAPTLQGVTGTVATITGTNGKPQLTLNGWPLYYFAGDKSAGDTSGQGVDGIWWVLTPAGERITS